MAQLKIICYYNTQLNIIPVKEFLKRYIPTKNDNSKHLDHKIKIFALIDKIIKHTAENGGVPKEPFSSWLHGFNFFEIKCRDGDKLIRILSFRYNNEKLVLLCAYEKPKLYQKGGKKKTVRSIEKENRKAQGYYEDFIINPQNYEEYEKK